MLHLKHTILLILLATLALGKSANKKTAVLDVKKVDVEMNQIITFNITNLSPSKAFMVNIETSEQQPAFNQFQVSIASKDGKSQQCHFKYRYNLCVIDKPAKEVSVIVTCLENRCQANIVFSQRVLIHTGEDSDYKRKLTVPGEIYKLGQSKFNTILEVYSQRDEYAVLSEEIVVFSNIHIFPLQQTEELDASSAVFGIKPISKEEEQYIYIENKSNKQEMLKFSLKSHSAELRDGITIVDFIENFGRHSHSNYTFVGNFIKNLQAKVRVFSPRDPKGIPLTFTVKGRESEQLEEKVIRELKFDPVDFDGHKFFDFTFCITKAVHHSFKFISFQLQLGEVEDKSIFFQVGVRDVDSFEISIFEHVYFASEAGERLHLTVEPQVKLGLSSGDKQIQILTNAQEKYFSSVQSCSLHKGCVIEISAESECQRCSFEFELKDEDIKNHVIYYEVRGDSIEGKVEFEEQIFFKYSMNSHSATQIVVNSINVIIYANFQGYQRCKVPSAACHQYAINQQNPMVVHNKLDEPTELVLGVFGLEKTAFKVRFLNEKNGMEVKLGEKFSYLMDDEEKELEVKFLLDWDLMGQEERLHFNLLSPLHSLKLSVGNEDGQTIESVQGYITFDRRTIRGNLFSISIEKINQFYDQYVHFTLLITTSDMAVRLDPTVTHYEKYLPRAAKTFLIEYDPSEVNALNIYTENLQKQRATMTLEIIEQSGKGEEEKPKVLATHKLMRDYEFIDLDADLQELDFCDDNCEVQVVIRNEGEGELEQSLTMMVEESVIGLDDSIWSIFEINQLSRTNHFYFIPRNQGKSITILFNTDDSSLSLDYRIYNTHQSINPQHWPFGTHSNGDAHMANSQEIVIPGNDPELVACWPTCVVLISINEAVEDEGKDDKAGSVIKSYKILASNSILELLEDTKLEFNLKNEEEKVLFIQASNVLKYEKLTFFTYYATGRARITATVVSNDKEFKLNGEKDFIFEELETVLPTHLITVVVDRELLKLESVLLKITVQAQSNLKMTLEYTSLLKDIYRLRMDDLEVTTLKRGEQIWYEFLPERDFALKLYRVKGFPLFKVFKCMEENYAVCLSNQKMLFEAGLIEFLQVEESVKLQQEAEGGDMTGGEAILSSDAEVRSYPFEVFVEKSFELTDEECEKCVYFMWVYCFEGDLELSINLRTALSEVELKESTILNERAEFGQHNKYLVSVARDKDTIITVNILDGAAKVAVADGSGTLQTKQLNSIDNSYKEFTINADEEEEQEEKGEEEQEVDVFGKTRNSKEKHVFKHVHVTVSGISEGPVEYVISYSVGSSRLYLQDGIVVQKEMIPEIPHTFLYRNRNRREHAYLTLSSQLLEQYEFINAKNSLAVKFYYYPDAADRNIKETFQPELPPQRNENYLGSTVSHVYELPSKYELYEIEVQTAAYLRVTASINHQELVYLPLGFEYLIKLHAGEFLSLAVDSPTSEYLEVRIKKCDESTPTLLYTNDAREFKRGIFEAEVDIEASNFRQYIKTKKGSKTLHLRLIGEQQGDSLLAISVSASSRQLKQLAGSYRAGNKGLIDYKMVETDTVEVAFKPATCGQHCNNTFQYYLVVSESVQQIYGELNCAGHYFVPQAAKLFSQARVDLVQVTEKHFRKQSGEYHYRVKLTGEQAFIGVKAVSDGEEVLYLPVEIRSFWGELGKASMGIVVMGSLACGLILVIVVAVSTKLARQGYKPISGDE